MARLVIRDIPEDAYEVIRKRARTSGLSVEAFLRDLVVDFAGRPTTEEVLARTDSFGDTSDSSGVTRESILEALDHGRR